jgi:hypothetical protein
MIPAPNDTDWQVAKFRRQQAETEGMRQQAAASLRPARADNAPVWADVERRCGAFLARAGQRLQRAYRGETPVNGAHAANERAVA